jgi:hypothetical protein
MNDMKLIMENWRGYLNEAPQADPTVGEFLETWGKQSPKSAKKIFGKLAKVLVGVGTGLATGAAAGTASGGAAAGLGIAAGAASGKVAEQAVGQLFDWIAGKGGDEMAKFLAMMADQQVPDDQRKGLAIYYDIDDPYEKLLQGMDSELANKYQKALFGYFKEAFEKMGSAPDPNAKLSNYLKLTANEYLKRFLFKTSASGVGVRVQANREG